MGKIFSALVVLIVLAGCASPQFFGARVREVSVDQSRFRVFMLPGGSSVEVHRVSVEVLPSLVLTLERAYRAIEIATGCGVVDGSLRGDQAIILADVDCMLF
ncbi:MAG: hypothetical protein ACC619_08440 [Paracoccaceae bacterium]